MTVRNQLNKIIKWTSSKFNWYRKSSVIEQILEMKPNTYREFECGSYGENNWNGGYHYTVRRTKTHIDIYDTLTSNCIGSIKVGE